MFTEQIEKLKRDYTDKYVLVDATRPELARFHDAVGRVKTVNMNGQVLVEFDDYHLNIGWYDIAPEFLQVVDKPPPKPPKPAAKKPAAKPAPSPKAAAKPEAKAKPAAKAGRPSVAEMLAAARGEQAAAPAEAKPSAEKPASPAKPPAAEPPKLDRSKLSVADMIAAARAGGAGTAPAKTQAEPPPVQEAAPQETTAGEAPADEPASAGGAPKPVDKSAMSIDDILAYCRQHDAQ